MKPILPRTQREYRYMERLAAYGYSLDEIFVRMGDPSVRSDLHVVFGTRYCAICAQKISFVECLNCGQTLLEGGGEYAI